MRGWGWAAEVLETATLVRTDGARSSGAWEVCGWRCTRWRRRDLTLARRIAAFHTKHAPLELLAGRRCRAAAGASAASVAAVRAHSYTGRKRPWVPSAARQTAPGGSLHRIKDTLFTLNEVINNKLPNSPGDELQPTSDIASVQHRRLARKHSTPPLHVIGSKPAPSPFLTTSTLQSSPPLNPCNIAAPASLSILESDPTTRAPNREHNGTPGRVGQKPVQAGAFRAGTPTRPSRAAG